MKAVTRKAMLAAVNRLTERDRQILLLVGRHQVLTTHQISQAFFDNPRVGRRRVQVLEELGLLDCFRPVQLIGTSPKHCVLTGLGTLAVAGLDPERAGPPRAGVVERLALRPDLKHLVGCNGVFCALLGEARAGTESELELWWPERDCIRSWGEFIRPDGFGRWREGAARLDFFLEYDTGVEHGAQILAKLPGYAAVARRTGISTPVLFWLHSARRETALHQRLARADLGLPIATASGDPAAVEVSGRCWRRVGAAIEERLRLVELATSVPSESARERL